MNKTNYIVRLSDQEIKLIEKGTAHEIGADDFLLGRRPVDDNALRLVTEWAERFAKERYEENPLTGKIGDKNKLEECLEMIAKVKYLTK
jgi:hypothetical protein